MIRVLQLFARSGINHAPQESCSDRCSRLGLAPLIIPMSFMKKKCIALIPLFGGIVFLICGLLEVREAFASRHWPEVSGIISESIVIEKKPIGKAKRSAHTPRIIYHYIVDGRRYSSERIIWGDTEFGTIDKPSYSRALEWVRKFPKGKEVTVAVNPKDPQQSVLVKGLHQVSFFKVYTGLALLVLYLVSAHPFFRDEDC